MADDSRTQGLELELNAAIDELRTALQRADDATANLQRLVPRVTQIGTLFDEIAAVINTGRQQLGGATTPGAYARPTLVTPSTQQSEATPQAQQGGDPWSQLAETWGTTPSTPQPSEQLSARTHDPAATAALTSFRLEFESKPGPLDLRAVDDAVSEHPSVRDVALLDYDGRKATLKVWIEDSATPSDIQSALVAKATTLFGAENEVTVVAHEDAA
ncbi:MAG: hypothetical protein HY873_13440 [Chloroflexi bacterium]|nr:hypothetical protein [Chloroflexota bacterium]